MLNSVAKRLGEQGISIEFDESAKEYLAKEGFDNLYGARPLRRAITKTVEDKLSEEILRGNIKAGENIKVSVKDGELQFENVYN